MSAGAILTKMDGDSRGGAALSMKAVSGRPVKFISTGERLNQLETFYPDRVASRILGNFRMAPTSLGPGSGLAHTRDQVLKGGCGAGMGDVLSLVEMAEKNIKEGEAEALTKRMMENKFDFNDFLKQFKMVSGMGGGLTSVMKMLPGAPPRVPPWHQPTETQ